MKKNIHPKYEVATVSCACGAEFVTRTTIGDIKLDICSQCHPFFTGTQRMLDVAGRVDKFNKRYAATGGKTVERKPKKVEGAKAKKLSGSVLSTTPKKLDKAALAAKPAKTAKAEKPAKAEKTAKEKTSKEA